MKSEIMKRFKSNKELLARPMNRGDYNKYRGWEIPDGEIPEDEGYLIEWENTPTTNMPHGHTNLIQWQPKDMFEAGNIPIEDIGSMSDGYHTFNELYEFRMAYNANLFNTWAKNDEFEVYKSLRHHDGELCFGGSWFVVVAITPFGQVTNHYKLEHWDLFMCRDFEIAKYEFDGHTSAEALQRLLDTARYFYKIDVNIRNEIRSEIMKYFIKYAHLPECVQEVCKSACVVAVKMNETLPDCTEKNVGLRKLLEARNCFVRATMVARS